MYMSTTVGDENYLSVLKEFFVQEGLAYRITPFNWKKLGYSEGRNIIADSETFYNNVMNRFKFGGFKEYPDYYSDETISRMVHTQRRIITELATQLYNEGEKEKAHNLLCLLEQEFPSNIVPHNALMGGIDIGRLFVTLKDYKNGCKILGEIAEEQLQYINWYNSFDKYRFAATAQDSYMAIEIVKIIIEDLNKGNDECKALATDIKAELNTRYATWYKKAQELN